jgi:hypothetical protein
MTHFESLLQPQFQWPTAKVLFFSIEIIVCC